MAEGVQKSSAKHTRSAAVSVRPTPPALIEIRAQRTWEGGGVHSVQGVGKRLSGQQQVW